jgi:signal transduction histidine kinase
VISPEEIFSRLEERRNSISGKSITWRYATVLFSIGVLTAVIFWGSYEVTLQQTHDANVIEVSSKQRTLRLSAEMIARQIIEETAENRRDTLIDKLETVLTDLEDYHNILAYGQIWNGPALPRIPEAQSYIFGPKSYLDLGLRKFIEHGHKLMITNISEIDKISDAYSGMMEAHSREMDFALDGIVAAYKHASTNKLAILQAIQIAGLFFVIAVLAFSTVFVFKPMARRIKDDFNNLEDICITLNAALGEVEFSRGKFEELGTENIELLEQLEVSKRRAEKASLVKSEFVSSMSHELRTPMNAILGFTQMLEFNPREPLTESQKSCVDHIMKGGHHLLELINEVLDLAKVESGKVKLSIEDVSPVAVLDECMSLVAVLAENRDINIDTTNVPDETPKVRADHTRFKQVLINLMSNAIKYNRESGSITIGMSETANSTLRIIITDTGDGIPEDKQGELFKPFSRLGAASTGIEGTGIGLVVCKDLVELMNGSIGFKSKPGFGSKFWFEIPLGENVTDEDDTKPLDAIEVG